MACYNRAVSRGHLVDRSSLAAIKGAQQSHIFPFFIRWERARTAETSRKKKRKKGGLTSAFDCAKIKTVEGDTLTGGGP